MLFSDIYAARGAGGFLILRNEFIHFIGVIKMVLQTEKIELETTVVDETKERESYCGQGNRRFSG